MNNAFVTFAEPFWLVAGVCVVLLLVIFFNRMQQKRQQELARFQMDEIDKAQIRPGEDAALAEEETRLRGETPLHAARQETRRDRGPHKEDEGLQDHLQGHPQAQ